MHTDWLQCLCVLFFHSSFGENLFDVFVSICNSFSVCLSLPLPSCCNKHVQTTTVAKLQIKLQWPQHIPFYYIRAFAVAAVVHYSIVYVFHLLWREMLSLPIFAEIVCVQKAIFLCVLSSYFCLIYYLLFAELFRHSLAVLLVRNQSVIGQIGQCWWN